MCFSPIIAPKKYSLILDVLALTSTECYFVMNPPNQSLLVLFVFSISPFQLIAVESTISVYS